MNLIKCDYTLNLTESGQVNPVRFAMCRVEDENIHLLNPWFKCRDYFSDWLVATRANRDAPSIYGFRPEGKTRPIPLESLTLAITTPSKLKDNIIYNLDTLMTAQGSELEVPTIIHQAPDVVVIRFDKFWLTSTQHLSLLTMIIRTFVMERNEKGLDLHNFLMSIAKGEVQNSETENWGYILDRFNVVDFIRGTVGEQEKLLELQDDLLKSGLPSTSEIHGYGGILSLSRFINKETYVAGTQFIKPFVTSLVKLFSDESETKSA